MDLKSNYKVDPTFQMSSLTDIIFLLLIFFLLTSSLVSVNALQLSLPSSNGTTAANSSASISITSDKQYFFNKDKIDFRELKPLLVTFVQENEASTVVLNAEQTVPIQEVVKVFDIAKDLQIPIVLGTNPLKQ